MADDARMFGKGDYYIMRIPYGHEPTTVYWFPGPWAVELRYAWFFESFAEAQIARIEAKAAMPEARLLVCCLEDLTERERVVLLQRRPL